MKCLLAVFYYGLFSGIAFCQIASPETVIRNVLETRGIDGHVYKIIDTMGDAVAVTITKVVAGKKLEPVEIDCVLALLTIPFADPSTVTEVADRQPRTTLFVLQCLDLSTTNQELKGRIAQTKKYVQDHYDLYMRSTRTK